MGMYTGNPDAGVTLTVTTPDDGVSARQAGSVNVPFGSIVDSIAAIWRRGMRSAPDLDALASLTPAANNDIVFVPRFGLFSFRAGAASGNEDNLAELRNDADTGTWVSEIAGMLRGEDGSAFAATDGLVYMRSGKIPDRVLHKRLVDVVSFAWSGSTAWTGTSYTGVAGQVVSPPLTNAQVGDRLEIEVMVNALLRTNTYGSLRLETGDVSGTHALGFGGFGAGGELVKFGPANYSSDGWQVFPVTLLGSRTVQANDVFAGSPQVFMNGKILAVGGQSDPVVNVDSGVTGSSGFGRVTIWRFT